MICDKVILNHCIIGMENLAIKGLNGSEFFSGITDVLLLIKRNYCMSRNIDSDFDLAIA